MANETLSFVTGTSMPEVSDGGGVMPTMNTTADDDGNATHTVPAKIFLQTMAAQGITGGFTFAALLITCYQVSVLLDIFHALAYLRS